MFVVQSCLTLMRLERYRCVTSHLFLQYIISRRDQSLHRLLASMLCGIIVNEDLLRCLARIMTITGNTFVKGRICATCRCLLESARQLA